MYATIVSVLKISTSQRSLSNGRAAHAQAFKCGLFTLANHLLNMYAKLSDMASARKLFDEMAERNLVSFSTMISGYCKSGKPLLALTLVSELQREEIRPNQFVFSSLSLACSKLKLVKQGRQVHAQVVVLGYEADPFVKTSLVDMYAKFEDLGSADSVFGECLVGDPVMCNSMISGLVFCGSYDKALKLFVEARRCFELRPTECTFSSVIKACSNLEKASGEQVHGVSIKTGYDFDCFVGTALVDMYGKYGDMQCSMKIFSNILTIDLALYNAVIVGFTQNGLDECALHFYTELILKGFVPDESTFSSVLRAFSSLKHSQLGRILHGVIEKSDFRKSVFVNTGLIDMYMKCGYVEESWRIFWHMSERNTISYNSMIGGLGQNAQFCEAVKLFVDMNRKCLKADLATFVVLMSSCWGYGKSIYTHAIKHGYGLDPVVQNAFLDCLVKAGSIVEAQEFFDKMHQRSVISWTTMISGLSQLGFSSKAVELFKRMQAAGVSPNCFTISCVLNACGHLSILELGRCIHGFSLKNGTDGDDFTYSSMLNMYANCGALEEAYSLFEELPKTDFVSWNSMITGLSKHGNATEALILLRKMENFGVKPNHVTFVSVLSACSRCGLVDEGVHIFESMTFKYGIIPSMEHYACMVDTFGRVGMLDRAKKLIDSMPVKADVSIWKTVLAASKLHGNVELAKVALDHVMSIEDHDRVSYVTMSNLYSEVGEWDVAEEMRSRMRNQGIWKNPGTSNSSLLELAAKFGILE